MEIAKIKAIVHFSGGNPTKIMAVLDGLAYGYAIFKDIKQKIRRRQHVADVPYVRRITQLSKTENGLMEHPFKDLIHLAQAADVH